MRDAALRFVVSPFWTLALWTASSIGDGADVPPRVRREILGRLRARDVEALHPMRPGAARTVPVFAAGTLTPGTHSVKDELERIAATPVEMAERVLGDLVAQDGNEVWHGPARAPTVWTRSFVLALARAWPAVEPAWRVAAPRLRREVERAATAASLGAQAEMLTGIWPGSRVVPERFEFDVTSGGWPTRLTLHGGKLLLTPMLGMRPRRLLGYDRDADTRELHDLTYAVRPSPIRTPAPDQDATSLSALVGPARSRILRSLTRPRDMGAIAELLQGARSSATRHVDLLQNSGLVERRTEGRYVIVRLTPRGERLLELYR